MAITRRHLITLFTVAVLAVQSAARASAQEPAPRATFQLYAIAATAEMLYEHKVGQPRRVAIGQTSFSIPHPVPDDRRLRFYIEQPAENPGEPPVRVPQAEATLPAGPGPFLVLLAPGIAGGLPLRSHVVDYSPQAHPADTFRIFSLSRRQVAVKIGESTFELRPGESRVVSYPEGASVWLQVAVADDGAWRPVVGGIQGVSSGTRTSLFLCDVVTQPGEPPGRGLLVRRIRDRPLPDEATAPRSLARR